MAIIIDDEKIVEELNNAIERELNDSLDAAIEKAKQDLEEALRGDLATIVMRLHKFYSVEFRQNQLIIKVENKS